MRIIDAHLHFKRESYFDNIARAAGHENTAEHLAQEYRRLNIAGGVVMGNESAENIACTYPSPLCYCVGLGGDASAFANVIQKISLIETHLQRKTCVGIKLYPGYQHFYIYDDFLAPLYKIAAKYNKPVAVHTGLLAGNNSDMKYSHPRVVGEAAARFPAVKFVMCHFGEPHFTDAAEVLIKHTNVSADLSGILEGKIPNMEMFCRNRKYYIDQLRAQTARINNYDRLMFGTDWPLANLEDYIEFTKIVIPQSEWDKVFFANANRIYSLNL